ncbi:MAG: carboxypeptidase-like regulatory domain-containing protein, partial [Chitinophagaceae bacterium]|nr:carboxypeptidase-like regulatory domain-containing protein [Chitinophagaceae bacterium]
MRHCFLSLLCSLFFTAGFAQDFQVTGQVTSKTTGKPVAGVTVSVKEKLRGGGEKAVGVTDDAGTFSVKASQGSVLVFSSIGWETAEVTVNDAGRISVVLNEKSTTLEDVVVEIGYGTQKKSLVTGALAHVSSQDIANKQIVRIEDALQGLASGVI